MAHRFKWFIYTLLAGIPICWAISLWQEKPWGTDFYPLYFAAERLVAGQSSYGSQATHDLSLQWHAPFALAGIAYPLPLILLVVPLTLFAFPVAAFIWTALGFAMSYASVLISRPQMFALKQQSGDQWLRLLLPFTFLPFYRGVVLSQATLVWFGISVLLLLAIQKKRVWLVACCVVLLMLKPQTGLVFSLYGLYWLFRHHRRGLSYVAIFGGSLLGVTLLLEPNWIAGWLQQMALYKEIVQPSSILLLGLVALVACWRLNLLVKLAILQVILFPISEVYSTLPLLIAWYMLAPRVAFIGTGVSWLWIIFSLPLSLATMWFVIFMPLIIAALWVKRPATLQVKQSNMDADTVHPETVLSSPS